MKTIEPWRAGIPSDIGEKGLEFQKRHHIYAHCFKTETGRCITWDELLKLLHSKESYMYAFTFPVTREYFAENVSNWEPEAQEICRIGYHNIDAYSWDIDTISRDITKLRIAFSVQAGDGPDADGYGRTWGTFFAASFDRQGHQITPFQIFMK